MYDFDTVSVLLAWSEEREVFTNRSGPSWSFIFFNAFTTSLSISWGIPFEAMVAFYSATVAFIVRHLLLLVRPLPVSTAPFLFPGLSA